MTTRVSGFVVTLEKDMREDDAREVVQAISLLKGVVKVEAVASDPMSEQIATVRLRKRVVDALLAAFEEEP